MPAPMQTCKICGADKERRRKFFALLKGGQYDQRCRKCRSRLRKAAERRDAARRKSAMNRIEKEAVDRFLSSINVGGATVPHTAELLESLMNYFGGVNGLAAMFYKQYCDSKPGSSFRTKLLDTAVRLVSKNTEIGGAKKPMELMTAEEIEAEINAKLQMAVLASRAARPATGRIVDATKEAGSPDPSAEPVSGGAAPDPLGAADRGLPEGQPAGVADRADESAHGGPASVSADAAPG